MEPKLFTAIRLYVDGVRDGHLGVALDKYVAAEAVRVALARRFQPLVSKYDRRAVIPLRGFEDGSQVVLHTLQTFGLRQVEQVGIDIFDLDADYHIVGWRTAVVPLAGRTRSGMSQIDGPTYVEDLHATAANKALVQAYAREVLLEGRFDRASRWVCPRTFAQHDPDVPAGRDASRHYLRDLDHRGDHHHLDNRRRPCDSMTASGPIRYTAIDAVAASGNFVATIGRAALGPTVGQRTVVSGCVVTDCVVTDCVVTDCVVADLYRVAAGRIVEHWNVREPVPLAP